MWIQRWLVIGRAAILVAALGGGIGVRLRRPGATPPLRVGRYSADQVFERTAQLARAMAGPGEMTFHDDGTRGVYNHDGRWMRVWCTQVTVAGGRETIYAFWDADSGDLWYVSNTTPWVRPGRTDLSGLAIQRAAQHWLGTLGLTDDGSRWQLAVTPQKLGDVVLVACSTSGRKADIALERATGGLRTALVWRTRSLQTDRSGR